MKRFPSKDNSLSQLKRAGLSIATVLDVGIRKDTPQLRQAFPDCKHVLFEPIVEHFEEIRGNYKDIDYTLEDIAVSDRDGELELQLLHRTGTDEITHVQPVAKKGAETRTVRALTLDTYLKEHPQATPYLLKIDVDGHETAILRGATNTLKQTACLIVEAPMPKLPERVAIAASAGFRVWDFVDFLYRDGALWQVDVIFIAEWEIAAHPNITPWVGKGQALLQPSSWFSLESEFKKTVRSWG